MRETDVWHELAAGDMPKLLADKLEPFGFLRDGDAYFYAEELLAGSFRLHVKVSQRRIDESFELSKPKKRSGV
jgi:hypothetical protein